MKLPVTVVNNLNIFVRWLALCLITFIFANCFGQESLTSQKLVDSFILIHPDTVAYKNEAKSYKWNYEQGLILEAIYKVWKDTKKQSYIDYIKKNIDYYVKPDGSIKTYKLSDFNLDNLAPGRVLLHLFDLTHQEKYKLAADTLMKQLRLQPRTSEGGFWHKKIYPYQMWLDGLYMAEPFYAEYSAMFNEKSNFDDIAKQFLLIREHSYDEENGLYFHGWDESKQQKWSDPIKGTSPNFWGRSIGWLMMALVDVLDYFPNNLKERNDLLLMFQQLSNSLLKYRDDDSKLWCQVIDKKNTDGNYIETSASSMFIYSFAKGYNKGYLNDRFQIIAQESFNYLVNNFIITDKNGRYTLTNVCSVGGLGGNPYRDGSFNYYVNEPKRDNDFKGYGSLILAANEIEKCNTK